MSDDLALVRLLIDEREERSRVRRCAICEHATVTNQGAAARGKDTEAEAAGVWQTCALMVPDALLKAACDDTFDYALGLRSGHVLRFEGCRFQGQWVHVTRNAYQGDEAPMLGTPYKFDRGVDVRLDEIVWCADAPQGS